MRFECKGRRVLSISVPSPLKSLDDCHPGVCHPEQEALLGFRTRQHKHLLSESNLLSIKRFSTLKACDGANCKKKILLGAARPIQALVAPRAKKIFAICFLGSE